MDKKYTAGERRTRQFDLPATQRTVHWSSFYGKLILKKIEQE